MYDRMLKFDFLRVFGSLFSDSDDAGIFKRFQINHQLLVLSFFVARGRLRMGNKLTFGKGEIMLCVGLSFRVRNLFPS